jgi:hypothetical protein
LPVADANRSIRFAPPLVISEEDLRKAIKIIGESLAELDEVGSACHSCPRHGSLCASAHPRLGFW